MESSGTRDSYAIPIIMAIQKENIELVIELLENDNRTEKCINGKNALHHSIYTHDIEIFKIILNSKIFNINDKDNNGMTALHLAANLGCANEDRTIKLKLLLDAGADITIRSNDNNTILHYAAMRNSLKSMQEIFNKINILPVESRLELMQVVNDDEKTALDLSLNMDWIGDEHSLTWLN